MSIFKACDIRGVAGDELNENTARRIGRSLGGMIQRSGRADICVGGDFRRSTPTLKQALVQGLVEAGAVVHDMGQLPTPAAHFAARVMGYPHVAIVTASHNAGKYNGIKFMVAGRPAVPELIRELQVGLDAPPAISPGKVLPTEVVQAYARWLPDEAAHLVSGARRTLRVVVDCMGGALADVAPRVLRTAELSAIPIESGAAIDPDFESRTPNPAVDENLHLLRERVVAESADLGVAFDGDGDRTAFVDHTGGIARPEQIGALLARHCFDRPTIVYDQKCASILAAAAVAAGGRAIMQPSGYGFIKSTMIDEDADLGIEVSGHYFFGALGGGDDGLFASLVVAGLVAQLRAPLADLVAEVGWPAITPDLRIPFDGDAAAEIERIAGGCGGQISRIDGVRAEYEDGWGLARSSITEPLITLRFEGRDPASLRQIAERFLAAAPELRSKVMEKIHE